MENLKDKDPYLEGKRIVLGLSGGVDSVVLLHYLHSHYPNSIRAVHCNHHLSNHCNEWHLFCQQLCQRLNIPYKNIDIHLEKLSNLEENSRKKRYLVLCSDLQNDEVLCTAHHQNDQAETLLLQLFRGSGVAGLAAMPKQKRFGKGWHYRPMLPIEKQQILAYAKQKKLNWIEDDSNKNTHFRRNYLRINIIPALETVYQNLTKTLARSAKHQSETLKLTRALFNIDLQANHIMNDKGRIRLEALSTLDTHRIKNILRHHLNDLKFLPPSDKVMNQILDLINAKTDAQPMVQWGEFQMRRYQSELYCLHQKANSPIEKCPIQADLEKLPNFSIRYRTEGQRIKLAGKKHSQSLKKVLQEAKIPPWERDSLKMYYIDDELRAMERIGYMKHAGC